MAGVNDDSPQYPQAFRDRLAPRSGIPGHMISSPCLLDSDIDSSSTVTFQGADSDKPPVRVEMQAAADPQMAALKERANAAFKGGHYEEALGLYRDAISLACADTQMAQNSFAGSFAERELLAVCHSNSAECLLQMGQWRAAVESSESALQLLPEHAKSRSRKQRALAGEMQSRLKDSVQEAIGSKLEIRCAAYTLSKLLLPSLFDGHSRLQGLYSGGDSPIALVTSSFVDRSCL